MLLNCGVGEDSWESLGLQGDPTSPSKRKSVLNIHWRDWCWSWSSNTLATWCEELTHLKRPWCWERLKAGGEGDDRGWDGWMASLTQWAWVWVNSGSWQGGLVCCSLQSGKESDTTEVIELHWTTRHEEGADRQSMRLERYHWCHYGASAALGESWALMTTHTWGTKLELMRGGGPEIMSLYKTRTPKVPLTKRNENLWNLSNSLERKKREDELALSGRTVYFIRNIH